MSSPQAGNEVIVSVIVDCRHRFRDLPTVTQLMGVKLEKGTRNQGMLVP